MKYSVLIVLLLLTICEPAPPKLVGVSNERLERLIRQALEGLKYVLLYGDEDLELEPMEPYSVDEDLFWSYEDDEVVTHEIYIDFEKSLIYGLSNYTVQNVKASMRDLDFKIELLFHFLDCRGKYKAGGYLFDKSIPLFGDGLANLRAENVKASLTFDLSLVDAYISVDDSSVKLDVSSFHARAQNVMGIPEPYTIKIVNVILHRLFKRYKSEVEDAINDEVLDLAEYTFTGMTMKEFIDFLKYLAKKADPSSPRSNAVNHSKSLRKSNVKLMLNGNYSHN